MYQYRNLHLLEISFKNKSEKDFFFFPQGFLEFYFLFIFFNFILFLSFTILY